MTYCAACREAADGAPDCAACDWTRDAPTLWPENRDAWELWLKVRTQWNVDGFGGLVGLRLESVLRWARLLGIRPTAALMGKIRALETAAISASREKAETS